MSHHQPPEGFAAITQAIVECTLARDLPRLRSTLTETTILRDQAFESPQVGWWNAALTIGQKAYEFIMADKATEKVHLALDKSPRMSRILRTIATRPVNQGTLATSLGENEGNLSKALDDLEERDLIMRRRESRSNVLFLSSLGMSILETHRLHCRLTHTCELLAPVQTAVKPVTVLQVKVPDHQTPKIAGIAQRIEAAELKLRCDHDKIEAASQRVRELRDLVARLNSARETPTEFPAAKLLAAPATEVALLAFQAALAKGVPLEAEKVMPFVEKELDAVVEDWH